MQDWSKWSVIFSILHKFLLHLACFLEVNASLLAYWDINISLNDESQVVYQAILQLLCMLLWISVYVSHWVQLFSSGESGEEIVARLKRDLLPTMFKGVMYWPVCDFITFRFIPVHLQVCDEVLPCLLSHMFFCIFLSWGQAVACSYDRAKLDFTNKHLFFYWCSFDSHWWAIHFRIYGLSIWRIRRV